jgi:4-amino-4-deoxy-L-arabinose transferase-like glycosyltransferase
MSRLRIARAELFGLLTILAAAAVLRFANLGARGGWDSDQGNQMLGVWTALKTGHLPQVGPLSSIGTFHHGALTYDLWLPAAWLGNGDPTFVVAETALGGVLVVALVWWTARTIGGRSAGLITALLAAVSASLIGYSTFIWNPTLIEPGAALAVFATWQAWRKRDPRWWPVAAIGLAVVMQAHIAGPMLAIPIGGAFVASIWRGPGDTRRRQLAWGLASAALIAVTYLPFLAYELDHDFAETRAIVAYFGSPDSVARFAPPLRILLATVRILAWPLTDWPLIGLREAFLVAGTVALSIVLGLIWRVVVIRRELAAHREPASQREPADQPEAVRTFATEPGSQATDDGDIRAGDDPSLADRRDGLALVGVGLFVLIVVPGLLLRNVAEVQELPTEQYHAYADPLALIAAGLVLGGLWQTRRAWRGVRLGRLVVTVALAGLVAWNATRLPPLTAPDGGWPAAHAAAQRLEADARGGAIAFVALPAIKGADAYIYPLTYDGATLTTPGGAATVVVLCDSFWVETGCGDSAAEAGWLVEASAGQGLTLVERFSPAPYRTLSVYRRTP